jgi:hypothetical protein
MLQHDKFDTFCTFINIKKRKKMCHITLCLFTIYYMFTIYNNYYIIFPTHLKITSYTQQFVTIIQESKLGISILISFVLFGKIYLLSIS